MGRRHEANETIMTIASMQIRPGRRLASALLPLSIALALAACGGGGGNVRPTPPPPTTPTGPGFTPTVDNDSSLTTLNPPAIPAQGVPVSLTDASINRHLSLTNALGALGAGLKGQGVTIGFVDSGVNRSHPTLTAFQKRVASRPAVQAALAAEGLKG